ncbi:hypothetical protein JCM11641_000641 [Rhodosporidiobolus odoratus]
MASSSSYSSLLRRSKLAAYNPAIDQVYTTNSANLSRSNFGLKRPLPSATTKVSPFVRLSQLDSNEGRTVFRKATRETKFVKQWQETGVGLQSDAFVPRSNMWKKWDRLELQSRFVDGAGPGAVKSLEAQQQASGGVPRAPNVFALGEEDFDRFLEELGERRDDFKVFVVAETNKTQDASERVSLEDFDLYEHAQRNPTQLIRLVDRFLRLPSSSTSSLTAAPLPQIHPTLALQYASPTPLESALAPPVRGRLLGQNPDARNRQAYNLYYHNSRNDVYASVLSTVAAVPASATGGATTTTFYPDATGVRSNAPGRASFRLNPTINPIPHALRTSISPATSSGSSIRKTPDYQPPTAEYEPSTLALRALELRPTVVSDTPAPLPGSPAYSGNLPADLSRNRESKGKQAKALSELMYDFGALGGPKGVRMEPRNLLQRKNVRTKQEQENWVRRREALLEERAGEAAKARTTGEGKRQKNQGKRAEKDRAIVDRLDDLLKGN